MRNGWLPSVLPCLLGVLASAPAVAKDGARHNDCASDAADRQGVGTYSQLLDGQPGSPGQPNIGFTAATGSGADQFGATISMTPGSGTFWCDTLFTLGTPGVTLQGDRAVVDDNWDIAWEQRWRADDAHGPSISTFAGIEIPIDSPGQKPQITLVGVVARTVSKGNTLYLNLIAQSDDGVRAQDWGVGVLVGYRHDLKGGSSIVIDGGLQPDGTQIAELAWQWPVSGRFSLGPGVSLSRYAGQVDATFGIAISRAIGPRN